MSWQDTSLLFAYKSSKIWKVIIMNNTSIHETCILCMKEKKEKVQILILYLSSIIGI